MDSHRIAAEQAASRVEDLWRMLQGVRHVHFVAVSVRPIDWNGTAVGRVVVDTRDAARILFRESGTWRAQGGAETVFTNVFEWTRAGDEHVRLAHLRFGPDRPVHLFELAARPDGSWSSVCAHTCGEDAYAAVLRPTTTGLAVTWTIRGPRKDVRIEYAYGS